MIGFIVGTVVGAVAYDLVMRNNPKLKARIDSAVSFLRALFFG